MIAQSIAPLIDLVGGVLEFGSIREREYRLLARRGELRIVVVVVGGAIDGELLCARHIGHRGPRSCERMSDTRHALLVMCQFQSLAPWRNQAHHIAM